MPATSVCAEMAVMPARTVSMSAIGPEHTEPAPASARHTCVDSPADANGLLAKLSEIVWLAVASTVAGKVMEPTVGARESERAFIGAVVTEKDIAAEKGVGGMAPSETRIVATLPLVTLGGAKILGTSVARRTRRTVAEPAAHGPAMVCAIVEAVTGMGAVTANVMAGSAVAVTVTMEFQFADVKVKEFGVRMSAGEAAKVTSTLLPAPGSADSDACIATEAPGASTMAEGERLSMANEITATLASTATTVRGDEGGTPVAKAAAVVSEGTMAATALAHALPSTRLLTGTVSVMSTVLFAGVM